MIGGATHALDSCIKPFDAAAAITREVAVSHLVPPSRLQVAASHYFKSQSYSFM